MTNEDVVQAWAATPSRDAGSLRSSNGNCSARDGKLYSYLTVIANRVAADVALFSQNTYSVTTLGKHMNPAKRAFKRAGGRVIVVPHVDPVRGQHGENIKKLTETDPEMVSVYLEMFGLRSIAA